MQRPSIAVCIVVYGSAETALALRQDLASKVREVVLVSTSAAGGHIADLPLENVGYGAAANAGFHHLKARCDWFVVMNDDLRLENGGAVALRARLGSLPDEIGMWSFTGSSSGIGPTRPHHPFEIAPHGAAIAIRRDIFDAIGGFDPRFFLYAEEVDLWVRMPRAASTGYETADFIVHEGAASSGTSPTASFELGRSTGLLNRKHRTILRAVARVIVRTVNVSLRRRSPRNAAAFLAGFVHGVFLPGHDGPSARSYGAVGLRRRVSTGGAE